VTLDGDVPSHCAMRLLRRDKPEWKDVDVRRSKSLNNIVERDNRAIKRRERNYRLAASDSGRATS